MKAFFATLICLTVFSGMANAVLLAEKAAGQERYVPLENIPGLTSNQPVSFSTYLTAIYKVGIILAAVLAVLMIVIGGIQYMSAAGNVGSVESAKETIWQAILGLLLVLGSYLILSAINPDLLKMEIGGATLNPTRTAPTTPTVPTTPTTPTPAQACESTAGCLWNPARNSCICR